MSQLTIDQIFTDEELAKARKICAEESIPVKRLRDEIVLPVIGRINSVTGQENDATYFAYLLEYACGRGDR